MDAAASFSRTYYRKVFIYTLIIVSSGALCLGLVFLSIFSSGLNQGYSSALAAIHRMQLRLAGQVAGLYAMATLIVIFAITFIHVFFSHRIAGPAFRLSREAELIGKGNVKASFKLRTGDHLADVADSLKTSAFRYGELIGSLERHADKVAAETESLAAGLQQGRDKAAVARAIGGLTDSVKSMEALLAEIKTC